MNFNLERAEVVSVHAMEVVREEKQWTRCMDSKLDTSIITGSSQANRIYYFSADSANQFKPGGIANPSKPFRRFDQPTLRRAHSIFNPPPLRAAIDGSVVPSFARRMEASVESVFFEGDSRVVESLCRLNDD